MTYFNCLNVDLLNIIGKYLETATSFSYRSTSVCLPGNKFQGELNVNVGGVTALYNNVSFDSKEISNILTDYVRSRHGMKLAHNGSCATYLYFFACFVIRIVVKCDKRELIVSESQLPIAICDSVYEWLLFVYQHHMPSRIEYWNVRKTLLTLAQRLPDGCKYKNHIPTLLSGRII
jgi:hypothetical protein